MAIASARAQPEERPQDAPVLLCDDLAPEIAALRALSSPAGASPCSTDPNDSTDKTLSRVGAAIPLALRAQLTAAPPRARSTEATLLDQPAPPSPSPGDDTCDLIDASSITDYDFNSDGELMLGNPE